MTAHTVTARPLASALPATAAPPAVAASDAATSRRRTSISLPPSTASARAARRFVAQVLAGADDALVDSAVLLVSELVTNAVVHGDSAVRLVVDPGSSRGNVRIEVHDGSDTPPRVAGFDPDALSGRGLALVDAVSDRWGVDDVEPGKRVWFELSGRGLESVLASALS